MTDQLEVFPDDWGRALAVVAHPDDMEYGAASAVARWTSEGKDIAYVMVTRGEAGISSMDPADVAPVRAEEQRRSCEVVGVSQLSFLDHADGLVVADLQLRKDLAAEIRRHRPEVVLSINFRDSWGGPSWNHADHRAVGIGLLDAARDAANPWLFTDLTADGLEPWDGVRLGAFGGSPQPTHAVDITAHIDAGVASLLCHELYLANLGGQHSDPATFLRDAATAAGPTIGVEMATTFEVFQL